MLNVPIIIHELHPNSWLYVGFQLAMVVPQARWTVYFMENPING